MTYDSISLPFSAQALQTLVEDDLEGHLSVMDVAPKSDGVFTKLFNDCDKMRVNYCVYCLCNLIRISSSLFIKLL